MVVNRPGPRSALAALLSISGVALIALAYAGAALSVDRSDPLAGYSALRDAAESGDQRAQELLTAVDRYVTDRRIQVADLGRAKATEEGETIGIQRLRLSGTAPWELQVFNDTEIRDRETFEAYRSLRHGALLALAGSSRESHMEAFAVPDRLVSIADFADALQCECTITAATVDIFAGETWVMSAGGEFPDSGPWTPKEVHNRLMMAVEDTLDMYPAIDSRDLRLTVRQLRIEGAPSDLAEASRRDGVLLIDPVADIRERYASRAAIVRVINAPDVFRWHAENNLDLSLVPSTILPVPSEAD